MLWARNILEINLPESLGHNVTLATCAANEAAIAPTPTPPSSSPMAPTPAPTPVAKPSSTPLEPTKQTEESSFKDPFHVRGKERAMEGESLSMEVIEIYWRQGTISSSDKEKSFIRNAYYSNLPKKVREGDVFGRMNLESLWKDGTLSATDEEKLSIRADSNSAIQQNFKRLKVNAMNGKWLDMRLINIYRENGFISCTDKELADITSAYELAKPKE
jgi:hypothetical protein